MLWCSQNGGKKQIGRQAEYEPESGKSTFCIKKEEPRNPESEHEAGTKQEPQSRRQRVKASQLRRKRANVWVDGKRTTAEPYGKRPERKDQSAKKKEQHPGKQEKRTENSARPLGARGVRGRGMGVHRRHADRTLCGAGGAGEGGSY